MYKKTGKNNPNYKDGRTLTKLFYCKEKGCNNKVSLVTALYGQGRCNHCKMKYRKQKHYNCGKNHPGYKGSKSKCLKCGKKLTFYRGNNHFCRKCLDFKNENNPNWKGGYTFKPYPLGWNKTFKEQIRYRDGYKCQICGCHERECNRKLHVHHIDYNKNNLKENNLISLCHSCHLKTNGHRKEWTKYFINKNNFYK